MSRIRNTVSLMLASSGLALVCLFAGCGEGENGGEVTPATRRIILLTNGNSPYWDAFATGAKQAEEKLDVGKGGLQVVIDRGNFSPQTQIDKLRQYQGATDIVGVAICVSDPKNQALVNQLVSLSESGVKLITVDSDIDRENEKARTARFGYLGTDNFEAGQELGKAAKALRPDGAKFATFVGVKSASNAQERIGGFQDGAGENFVQLESMGDQGQADTAKKNVRDSLDRHDDLNTLVGIWSYNTPAIVDIVSDLGIREKTTVVGFDADPPSIAAMEKGNLDAMLVQDPYQMGFEGVRLLTALINDNQADIKEIFPNYGKPDGDIHETGLKVVVPSEESPIKADLFSEGTTFLTLEQFKEWLAEYNLTGS
ncbi:D-ribose-binding periplasmic protein precursor [Polystyrenella longa]|uniref:D-ribose-binding periplasmic protein n=1 Tax=Polystyrenella longa TaxID=2528007 RepID=A0A518CHN2_9PLAN|nr:substrate-binding domain-containing protein [Polystyrenella longa]QDU78733.1 D-ribose-binding periplasmic protein precursor [Polystyrenella longa]